MDVLLIFAYMNLRLSKLTIFVIHNIYWVVGVEIPIICLVFYLSMEDIPFNKETPRRTQFYVSRPRSLEPRRDQGERDSMRKKLKNQKKFVRKTSPFVSDLPPIDEVQNSHFTEIKMWTVEKNCTWNISSPPSTCKSGLKSNYPFQISPSSSPYISGLKRISTSKLFPPPLSAVQIENEEDESDNDFYIW